MRIRQEDAQIALHRALTDVSSSGGYSHQEQEGTQSQDDSADTTNATASDACGEHKLGLESNVKDVASPMLNSAPLAQANGPKIRPPAFLTPVKSPKFQTTTPPISSSVFTAPLDVSRTTRRSTQGALGQRHRCQRKHTESELLDTAQSAGSDSANIEAKKSTDGASPLPVMPSRVAETESWAPKARARG
jgi:hypothetical protein